MLLDREVMSQERFFQAQARNSVGTGNGTDMVFKTKKKEEEEAGVPYPVLNPALLLLMEEEPVFI